MAVELVGFRIDVETQQAKQDLGDVERALERTGKTGEDAIGGVDKAFKKYGAGLKEIEKQVADLEKAQTQAAKKAADETEKAADRSSKAWKIGMAAGTGAFVAAIKAAADYADRLGELNQQTGLSVVALQKMDAAARLNGSSLEAVANSFGVFQDRLIGGDKSVVGAVRALGINLDALKQQSPDEQMRTLAEAVSGVADPTLKANIATDLFGKSGRALIPTLQEISDHYNQLPAQSAEAVAQTGALADKFDSLKQNLLGLMISAFAPFGQMLQDSKGQTIDLGTELAKLRLSFAQLASDGLVKAERAIYENAIAWSELLAKIPGAGVAFGVTQEKIKELKVHVDSLSGALVLSKRDFDEEMKKLNEGSAAADKHRKSIIGVADALPTLTQQLAATRAMVDHLTADQKAQIDAGLRMHESVKNITAALNAQYPALHLTEAAVQEYQNRLKDTVKSHKEQDAELRLLEQAWKDQRKEIEETEKFQHRYDMSLKSSIDFMHAFTQAQVDEATKGAERFDALINKEFKQIEDSNKATNENIRQMSMNSLAYEVDSIRRAAVEKKQMYTDDSVLAQQARDAIDREAATAIEKLKRQHDSLRNLFLDIRDQVVNLGQTVNQNFASMLLGAQSFGDGFKNIWNGLKQTAIQILTDILEYYEKVFIARFILGMLTGGASWSQALAGAFTGGGGGTGGLVTSALGMGGGAAGAAGVGTSIASADAAFASTGGAAAAGGGGAGIGGAVLGAGLAGGAGLGLGLLGTKIFGGSGWKAAGFGAASGAATGAIIGSVVPGIGTGIGAGVGALAGFIGGWIGKSVGEAINDARDEFLKSFGTAGTGEGSAFYNLTVELAKLNQLGLDGSKIMHEIFQPDGWDEFNQGLKDLQAAFNDLRFVQDKVNTGFQTLQDQQAKAIAQGMDQSEVLRQQAGDYSLLYQAIVRTGAQAPDGLAPILESLISMGALVDDNGAKVNDLSAMFRIAAQDGSANLDAMTLSLREVLGSLDDTTRAALLNTDAWKSVLAAGGLIGPQLRDPLVQAAQAANLTTEQVNALANALGVNVSGAARDAADAINDIPTDVHVRTVFDNAPDYGYFPNGTNISQAARGGYVTDSGVQYLATGGMARILGFKPRGSDTVPAMLTPGEGVINRRGMAALSELNRGSVGGDTVVNITLTDSVIGSKRARAELAREISTEVLKQTGARQKRGRRIA